MEAIFMDSKTERPGRRGLLLPVIASVFAEVGYRGATTALLARRCQVQETILYRIWPDKQSMFVDAIDFVADHTIEIYGEVLKPNLEGDPLDLLLSYESSHLGEFKNYRIVFSALAETQTKEIREALQRLYSRLHAYFVEQIARSEMSRGVELDASKMAWAVMGLGTMMTIVGELGLMTDRQRENTLVCVVESLFKRGK
jgi:AcrR family transcriptional regulator